MNGDVPMALSGEAAEESKVTDSEVKIREAADKIGKAFVSTMQRYVQVLMENSKLAASKGMFITFKLIHTSFKVI